MKFTEHLSAHITPEWRKQYIAYEEMKDMIYTVVEEAPSVESVEPEVLRRHFAQFDELFFQYCDSQLKKINTFYSEKLAEATRKYATLEAELQMSIQNTDGKTNKSLTSRTGSQMLSKSSHVPTRKTQDLKLAYSEFYLSLILLQNYQTLNFTGFRKILKKHDKLLVVDRGAKWRQDEVEGSHIYINKDIDHLISETENLVTTELEGGDRQRAMKRLRVPPLGEQQSPWTTFKVGLFSGAFVILIITAILTAIFLEGAEGDNLKVAFRLYRGPLLVIEFVFLMGVNVYGWRSSGVNHVLIFELDPRNHLSEQDLMEVSSIMGVVWSLSLLTYFYSASLSIPPYANPLALVVIMLVFMCNPVRVFRHEARFWLGRVMLKIVAAPFFRVGFADFWLADQLNSLVYALLDFQFLICFYITNGDWMQAGPSEQCSGESYIIRPIVNCLPAWFRFAQCLRRYRDSRDAFPHLVNAGKYATTFLVVIFGTLRSFYEVTYGPMINNPFFYLWILSSIISSTYAYTWDIRMDWGLLDKNAGENTFLREEMVYSSKAFYYFAIFEDLFLRFSWTFSFFLVQSKVISADLMTSIIAPLEVFRRFIWNFFRLENEHLNNCGQFRAVRDISVAPKDSSDQTQIIRMMDEESGVLNRSKKKGKKGREEKQPLMTNSIQMEEAKPTVLVKPSTVKTTDKTKPGTVMTTDKAKPSTVKTTDKTKHK